MFVIRKELCRDIKKLDSVECQDAPSHLRYIDSLLDVVSDQSAAFNSYGDETMPEWSTRPREQSEKGKRECRLCNKWFMSADRIRSRICDRCKKGSAWQGSQEKDCLLPALGPSLTRVPKSASQVGKNSLVKARPSYRRAAREKKKA